MNCSLLQVTLNAVLNDEYSEDLVAYFATKPRLDAASDLEVEVKPSIGAADITWEAWKSVSCISEYQITICPVNDPIEGCLPTVMITKAPGLPAVTYTAENLNPCTDYNLEIQPMYPEAEIESKMVSFRTQSPAADSLSVGEIKTESAGSGSMLLEWPAVKCAENYFVYQKQTGEEEWQKVADTPEQAITIDNITPCTELHFALTAVLNGDQETEKSVGNAVMSALDESAPFAAPNLKTENADTHADVSWDHAACIEAYVIKVCQESYTDCITYDIQPTAEDDKINYRIGNLAPCTLYSLEVIPQIEGKVFTARTVDFTTTNGTPQAPLGFKTELKEEGKKAALNWEAVQCATGYKIYHKVGDPEGYEVDTMTEDLAVTFDDPTPCQVKMP